MHEDQAVAQMEQALGPEAIAFARERANEAARAAPYWEADVAPIMDRFRDTRQPGALVMVVAEGMILSGDVLAHRPVGAQARARVVVEAVMEAARKAGVLPERLHVRDKGLAEALRPELQPRGIAAVTEPLPALDEALAASLEHLSGSAVGGVGSSPWTWAETEAPSHVLAEFHAAAAAYHRAAPWRALSDSDALLLTFPGEDEPWAASVMGGGSIHYGLALYSEPADLEAMFRGSGEVSDGLIRSLRGFSLSMSYDPAGELPKPMRREVAAAGWEVAGPSTYPTLLGIGVPGRRITAELLSRVALACRSVVSFTAVEVEAFPWRDPATGVEIDLMYSDGEDDELPELAVSWAPLEVSHPVGPEGPAADLNALLLPPERVEAVRAAELARLARFTAWVEAQRPSRAAREREVRTAQEWTEMLRSSGTPAYAATEHELRMFLYGWLVMEGSPTKPMGRYLTRSLRRLFDYYGHNEGFTYPWAERVLGELDALVELLKEGDVREVLANQSSGLHADLAQRALLFESTIPGTALGWSLPFHEETMRLRDELRRQWLIWHDEVVRAGTTDTGSVRELLVARQREWENTPHLACGGRTPRQVVVDADSVVRERMEDLGFPLDALGAGLSLAR